MEENNFYTRMMFEAMMYAGGFRIQCSREHSRSSSSDLSPIRRRSISPENRRREFEVLPCERFEGNRINYTEIANKNARELITEEEQVKLKAEKKRAKKERQKQKRKNIHKSNSNVNNNCENTLNNISDDVEDLIINSDDDEIEELDVGAAFVCKAIKKVKNYPLIQEIPKPKKDINRLNLIVKIAIECENKQRFKEAIQYLSEAVIIAPRRIDLLLHRSLNYYKLEQFEKSIRDAEKVVQYSPNNTDGYIRLGEAHFALNNLSDAEAAFTKLLSLKTYCKKAEERLFSIHMTQLENMGYHPNEAYTALHKSKNRTLDEAIDFLTALENGMEIKEDLYYSDEEGSEEDYEEEEETVISIDASLPSTEGASKPIIVIDRKSRLLTDSSNPLGCCSLFVGNLKKGITYQEVNNVFIKFGDIRSIKLTTVPNCYAFINYVESESAGCAMEALQGSRWLLSTNLLLLKYPITVINNIISTLENPELVLSKLNYLPSSDKPLSTEGSGKMLSNQECHYWRTTGCVYGIKCFKLHLPEHRGVDISLKKLICK